MTNNVNNAFGFGPTIVEHNIFFPGGFLVSDQRLGVIVDPPVELLEALVQALGDRWPTLDSAISLKKLVQAEIDKKKADKVLVVKLPVSTSKLGGTKAPVESMTIAEREDDMNMAYLAAVTDLATAKDKLEKEFARRQAANLVPNLNDLQSVLGILFLDDIDKALAGHHTKTGKQTEQAEIEMLDIRSRKRFENDVDSAEKALPGALHDAKKKAMLHAADTLLASRFNQKKQPARLMDKISSVHPQLFEQACVLACRPEKNLFQMVSPEDGNVYATLKWKDDHAEAFFMNSGPIKGGGFDTMTEALNAVLRKYW